MLGSSAKVCNYQCCCYDYDTCTILRRLHFVTEKQEIIFGCMFVQDVV